MRSTATPSVMPAQAGTQDTEFFLGLQTDCELVARRREIGDQLKAIRPRAA